MSSERRLAAVASAEPYRFESAPLARRLETKADVWRTAAADPGWQGQAATAASTQFAHFGRQTRSQVDSLHAADAIVERANSALSRACADYHDLPTLSLGRDLLALVASGTAVAIPGFGPVADVAGVLNAVSAVQAKRENAARTGIERFQRTMDGLADELEALMAQLEPATVRTATVATMPAAPSGKKSLADILRDYQVSDDPGGMTTWPGWPWSMFTKPVDVTRTEADMLDDLLFWHGLLGCKDFEGIKDQAFDEADSRYPSDDRNDDHNDAFRHTYWNALMASSYGDEWAERYGTAHEGSPSNTLPGREAMDLYNNEVGRRIAAEHPGASREELADLVADAVRDGDVLVIDANGDLAWSNTVPLGRTGDPRNGQQPGNPKWDDIVDGDRS